MPLELTTEEARRLAIGTKNRATRGKESAQAARKASMLGALAKKKVPGWGLANEARKKRRQVRKRLQQDFEDSISS